MELFKKSLKSICHQCFNFNKNCIESTKSVDTDKKLLIAFVKKCSLFNRDMPELYCKNNITSENKVDSRISMMGGGYEDK